MGVNLSSGSGRGRRGFGARSPMSEINVTPLVDVMLVLLIIFMVTAPLLKAGVPVNLPESKAKALGEDKDQVTLSLSRDGRVYLDDVEVAPTLPGAPCCPDRPVPATAVPLPACANEFVTLQVGERGLS
ncbi:MAG: biopolymer transporter ExbD [Novosphingobium sp.]